MNNVQFAAPEDHLASRIERNFVVFQKWNCGNLTFFLILWSYQALFLMQTSSSSATLPKLCHLTEFSGQFWSLKV